ncbi:MAG: hypothetical protein ABWY14_11180 [Tardiphaga sp.]
MTGLALFDVLKDFGTRPQTAATAFPALARAEPAAPPQPSVEEIIRAEVTKAEAALEERLALMHEAELEALRQMHAGQMDAVLRQIGESAGETIALRLGEMEERIGHQAATSAARILGSFLSDELQKRSMDSLARSIRAAVEERETFRIDIRGPQSLYAALQAALGDQAGNFGYIEAPGFDLSVTIDGNLFETRLSEWSAILSEILE